MVERERFRKELTRYFNPIKIPDQESTFRLGYKPSHKDKQEMAEKKRNKRLAKLEGKHFKEKIHVPPIEQSFMSIRLINSGQQDETFSQVQSIMILFEDVSIHAVDGDESKEMDDWIFEAKPRMKLNNWSLAANECERSTNDKPEFDLEKLDDVGEDGDEEANDSDLSPDLLRLVDQEERQIMPHKKDIDLINLGIEVDKKEVKIGTTLTNEERLQLIDILKKYVDVFTWSYQDMPDLIRR